MTELALDPAAEPAVVPSAAELELRLEDYRSELTG